MTHLDTSISDGIATLTMNRPEARNALSMDMRTQLCESLHDIERDKSVRCVVLTGAGDHFMAGGDVKSFKVILDTEPDVTARRHEFERLLHNVHDVIMKMRNLFYHCNCQF